MRINVGGFLGRRALLSPGKVGLVCEGREFTFLELNQRANRLAHAMEKLGVRPGDRVGLLSVNGVADYDLFFGLAKLGAILVPINYRLAVPELLSILEDSGVRVLVYDPEFADMVSKVRDQVGFRAIVLGRGPDENYHDLVSEAGDAEPIIQSGDDDVVVILYTVWATGRPKGVMLTHLNFLWTSVTTMATLTRLGPTYLLALPLFHIGGLAWLPVLMHLGIRCALMPRFDPDRFLDLIPAAAVTAFGAVPTMLYFLKDSPNFDSRKFSGLSSILAYGSAVPVSLIRDYAQHGIEIQQLYGLTECTGGAMVIDAEHALAKAGSCGLPFFHTLVKLVDELGQEVPRGETGEVIIRGAQIMKGYWNQPEATENALRGGWLYTGDLARQDENGYYYIVDRKKDLIISGGENIFPGEIERVIHNHPGVSDVAVLASPDPVWGELVMAAVVKKTGAVLTEKEIMAWCEGEIAGYKVPRQVIFIESLPRTLTGKMEKRKLRKMLQLLQAEKK